MHDEREPSDPPARLNTALQQPVTLTSSELTDPKRLRHHLHTNFLAGTSCAKLGSGTRMVEEYELATRLAHEGTDPFSYHGFVNVPVVRGSTVLAKDAKTLRDRSQAYTYGTAGTPTTRALCDLVSHLEGADGTILTSSGLSAIAIPFLALCKPGDHVLIVDSVYAPTRRFAERVLKRLQIEVEYYDPNMNGRIAELMRPNTTVVFLESPASNTFEVQDVAATCEAAHQGGATTMMDNTYATALLFPPMQHGVDVVIHAATKYPSGHSDVLMGFVSASGRTLDQLKQYNEASGNCVSPDDAALVLRGMRTMQLRLREQGEAALEVAQWLQQQTGVLDVLHPALPEHPTNELFQRQFGGSSGIFSFVLDGNADAADRMLDAMPLFGLGYSWAGFESLAVPVDLSDRTIMKSPQRGSLIRLQIGLEATNDLKRDLHRGLEAALHSSA